MLSVENSPSSDPPHPCEISKLQSNNSSDEKSCDKLAALQEVDLESGLDEENPLPRFSIRDYVFNARNKDIGTNWPFSQKNLQLCLKHGVKDLLPPFQPPDSVRNQAALCNRSCISGSSSNCDGGRTRLSDRLVSVSACDEVRCDQQPSDCVDIANSSRLSSRIEKENKFSSGLSTAIQSHSETYITDSVPINKSPCQELVETETSLLESSAAKKLEAAKVFPESPNHRTEATVRHPVVKKCRLIVKLGCNWTDHQSSNELDSTTPSHFVALETMASKVCPVCKTFSSSSNTTLNAHIDQCLSGGSIIKWTASAKVVKHRIKPRKTKLMVDIYETAPHCTLEELDRRNGTNWAASNSCLPAQEIEVCAEERKQVLISSVSLENNASNQGAVYVDANGTKLRILSRFYDDDDDDDDPSVSRTSDTFGPKKLLKGGGKRNILLAKKKKKHMQKHRKLQKLAPRGKRSCSSLPIHSPEVRSCQMNKFSIEGSPSKEVRRNLTTEAQIQLNDDGLTRLRRSVSSKKTCHTKKATDPDKHQSPVNNGRQNFSTKGNWPPLCDSDVQRSFVPEDPITCPGSRKRTEFTSNESRVYEYSKQAPLRKREGLLSFDSQGSNSNGKSSLVLPKYNTTQLTQRSTFEPDGCNDPPNYAEQYLSSPRKKRVMINAGPVKSPASSGCKSKTSVSYHACLSKVRRFSSLRKNLLTVRGAPLESKFNSERKFPVHRNSEVDYTSESGEGAVVWQTEGHKQHDSNQIQTESQRVTEELTNKISVERTHVLKIKKRRGAELRVSKKEAVGLVSPKSASQNRGHDLEGNINSCSRGECTLASTFHCAESSRKEIQILADNVIEPLSGIAVGASYASLTKSLDHELSQVTNLSAAKSNSRCFIEAYEGPLCGNEAPTLYPSEPDDGQVMFCADDIRNSMLLQNADMGADDSKGAQENYFEVDPIPIPGPPGSFLPSPGGSSSEDNQGLSSLTSNQIHSSEDRPDLIDRDSSDSPVSATSTVSNSAVVVKSTSRSSSDQQSLGTRLAVHDESGSGFPDAIVDDIMGHSARVPWSNVEEAQNINIEEIKVYDNGYHHEKGLLPSFRNDQSCCCSRREGVLQGISLNYQESQILRRRNMTSVPLPVASGKQRSCDQSKRSSSLDLRSEVFSLSNYSSSSVPEKVVLPSMKSPMTDPLKHAVDSDPRILFRGGEESASPSSFNPVLRLMGKDLMVVNKEEDTSPPRQLRVQAEPSATNERSRVQLNAVSGIALGNVRNEDFLPFNHVVVSQGPRVFGQNQPNNRYLWGGGGSDYCRFSNGGFRSNIDFESPQTLGAAAAVVFPSKSFVSSSFVAPAMLHDHKGRCGLPHEQSKSKDKPVAAPVLDCRNKDFLPSSINPVRGMILIDDSSEREAHPGTRAAFNEGARRSQFSLSGIGSEYKTRLNPCYGFPGQGGGSPLSAVVSDASFQMPPSSKGSIGSPVKWNCITPGASSMLHPSSSTLTAPSPPSASGHPRSTLYYSSGFL